MHEGRYLTNTFLAAKSRCIIPSLWRCFIAATIPLTKWNIKWGSNALLFALVVPLLLVLLNSWAYSLGLMAILQLIECRL